MYVVAPLALAGALAIVLGAIRVPNGGGWIGGALAALFSAAGVYSAVVMNRNPRTAVTPHRSPAAPGAERAVRGADRDELRAGVLGRRRPRRLDLINRLVRVTPLLFLGVTTYFENNFEFYDLVVKRGAALAVSVVLLLGGASRLAQPWFDAVPREAPRAVDLRARRGAGRPAAAARAGRHARAGAGQAWFGRHYTTTPAVTHVLGSMQTATDEDTLVAAVEAASPTSSTSP